MDTLPLVLVDRICLFLVDIRDASALQRACKRLRCVGLGPECKWHWRLNNAQSWKLFLASKRNQILKPGTSIHTLEFTNTFVQCTEGEDVVCMLEETYRQEMESFSQIPDTDDVLVNERSLIGQFLKANKSQIGMSTLEVLDARTIPFYAIPESKLVEAYRKLAETSRNVRNVREVLVFDATYQEEVHSLTQIPESDCVLVSPQSRIGRFLKTNESRLNMDTLTVIDGQTIPLYAIPMHKILGALPKTSISPSNG